MAEVDMAKLTQAQRDYLASVPAHIREMMLKDIARAQEMQKPTTFPGGVKGAG